MTFEEKALAAGGHLGDDVAFVVFDELHNWSTEDLLAKTLLLEDTALD